jgi:hypothetical protein
MLKHQTMLNYQKLMEHSPTVYETFVNKLGQTIDLVEHPFKGDEAPVIVVCHELKLAAYSSFFECEDMTAEDGEYQPSFEDGKLWIGDFLAD